MKIKIMIVLLVISMTTTIAEDPLTFVLNPGANNVSSENYFPAFPVSKLVNLHPQIQSVSYEEYGQTFGYVNALGGIGTDFLIQPGKFYEIYVSEEIYINLNEYSLNY